MKRRQKESGFALLLVFLMAACVAIMLYLEMPRVAFEAERQRELLLIDRGNQYKRAIQVFVTDRVNNPTARYPASVDELVNFNNHRYLRKKYLDPMTGKDEWRLVHINGGVLTDSVTSQQSAGAKGATSSIMPTPSEYISVQPSMDSDANGGTGGINVAMRRRPSDANPQGSGDQTGGGQPGTDNGQNGQPPSGIASSSLPGQGGGRGQGQPVPVQPQNTQPCTVYIGGCPPTTPNPANPPGAPPGMPAQPGNPSQGYLGGGPMGGGQQPGQQPGQTPFGTNPQAQAAAASMIGDLLTRPRPGGMPSGMPGATVGGGIAGVASKYESEGIMIINERTAINEWEYIFDRTRLRPPPNPVTSIGVGSQTQTQTQRTPGK